MSRATWSVSGLPVSLGRRRFVIGLATGAASLAAGAAGLAAVRLVPAGEAAIAPGIAARGDALEAGSVDDVWGLHPHYSAPIGFGRPRHAVVPPAPPVDDPQLAG